MIENQQQLEMVYMGAISKALENTVEAALNKLVEIIEVEVYNSYNPTFYERTGQFKDSWESTKPVVTKNIASSQIWQRFETMVWNGELFQHGNPLRPLEDGALAEIINSGHIGNAFNFPQLGARPFWDTFLKWCDSNLSNVFYVECAKLGLPIKQIGFSF